MQKKFESRKQEYLYQLLDRLRTDCEYYLGNGNHHPQALWAGNEQGQIDKMREIWNQLEEKPEWLTWEDISEYAAKMGVEDLPSTKDGTAEREIQNMLDRNYEKEKKVGLEEADINKAQNSNVDLEKEKEEIQKQLDDVEELQAKKKELDDKVDELFEENKEIKEESQVSNYTLEQVGSCLKDKGNDFKMQIQGSDTKTNWLNIDKDDLQKIYNTLSYKKKKTESAYDDLNIESGSEEEAIYNNLVDRNLKDEFNALSKEEQKAYLELIPENGNQISSELIKELAELSDLDYDLLYWVINIRGNNINESKNERFVEFDVTIWHNDVNQKRIMNTLSDIIYDNAGELLDTSNMEIINFDKTKYTLQVKIDKNITEKQLDEKISDGIYDIGAEVDDISEYREIQPKTIIKESKDNSFPSSDFSSEKLSYSDLDELISTFSKFKKFITPKQEKWLIENDFSVNELYEGLKEILTTFKSSAFKEIISIDEYIEELNNI